METFKGAVFVVVFAEVVRQVSMGAEDQMQKLKGTVITDEIASDFLEIGIPYARNLLRQGCLTQEQFNLAQIIEEKLKQMTQKKRIME